MSRASRASRARPPPRRNSNGRALEEASSRRRQEAPANSGGPTAFANCRRRPKGGGGRGAWRASTAAAAVGAQRTAFGLHACERRRRPRPRYFGPKFLEFACFNALPINSAAPFELGACLAPVWRQTVSEASGRCSCTLLEHTNEPNQSLVCVQTWLASSPVLSEMFLASEPPLYSILLFCQRRAKEGGGACIIKSRHSGASSCEAALCAALPLASASAAATTARSLRASSSELAA